MDLSDPPVWPLPSLAPTASVTLGNWEMLSFGHWLAMSQPVSWRPEHWSTWAFSNGPGSQPCLGRVLQDLMTAVTFRARSIGGFFAAVAITVSSTCCAVASCDTWKQGTSLSLLCYWRLLLVTTRLSREEIRILKSVCLRRHFSLPFFGILISGGRDKRRKNQRYRLLHSRLWAAGIQSARRIWNRYRSSGVCPLLRGSHSGRRLMKTYVILLKFIGPVSRKGHCILSSVLGNKIQTHWSLSCGNLQHKKTSPRTWMPSSELRMASMRFTPIVICHLCRSQWSGLSSMTRANVWGGRFLCLNVFGWVKRVAAVKLNSKPLLLSVLKCFLMALSKRIQCVLFSVSFSKPGNSVYLLSWRVQRGLPQHWWCLTSSADAVLPFGLNPEFHSILEEQAQV